MGIVLLNKADKPAISVSKDAKVIDAVRIMVQNRVGATVVLENGRCAGIFTERDVMSKVVLHGLDPKTTPVSTVMTSPVIPIDQNADPIDAMKLMIEKHIRHLPVVDADNKALGMLSIRHLLQEEVEDLKREIGALQNYAGYDGGSG